MAAQNVNAVIAVVLCAEKRLVWLIFFVLNRFLKMIHLSFCASSPYAGKRDTASTPVDPLRTVNNLTVNLNFEI